MFLLQLTELWIKLRQSYMDKKVNVYAQQWHATANQSIINNEFAKQLYEGIPAFLIYKKIIKHKGFKIIVFNVKTNTSVKV